MGAAGRRTSDVEDDPRRGLHEPDRAGSDGGDADWKYELTPYVPGECHPVVFFDIEISGDKVGRVEFTLRDDLCPKTCENFRALCTGERGDLVQGSSRKHLWHSRRAEICL